MSNDTTPTSSATTSSDAVSQETKRDELRTKIEASERRIAERTMADQARDAAGAATTYVRENPLTALAGAIVIGLLIGGMTKPGRRAAVGAATAVSSAATGAATSATRTVKNAAQSRDWAFGAMIADTIASYAAKLMDEAAATARAGKDTAEDLTDSATTTARQLRRDAGYAAANAADKSRTATRRTRRRAERVVRELTGRISN